MNAFVKSETKGKPISVLIIREKALQYNGKLSGEILTLKYHHGWRNLNHVTISVG